MTNDSAITARKAVEAALSDPLTRTAGLAIQSAQVMLVLKELGWSAPAVQDLASRVTVSVVYDESEFSYTNKDALVIAAKLPEGLLSYARRGGDLNNWTMTCTDHAPGKGINSFLEVQISGPPLDEPAASPAVQGVTANREAERRYKYAHEYTEMDGSPYRRKVSAAEFTEHKPDGHMSDGTPYWNYRSLRREVGPWVEYFGLPVEADKEGGE